MDRFFLYGLDAAATALLWTLPPLTLVAVAVARRRRRAGWPAGRAVTTTAGEMLLGLSVLAILMLTLMPTGTTRSLELRPLAHIGQHLARTGLPAVNDFIGGNVLLFVPFGFLLAWRLRANRTVVRVALVAALLSTAVEATQFVLAIGRQTLIDDVILNTLGATLGAIAWQLAHAGVRAAPTGGRRCAAGTRPSTRVDAHGRQRSMLPSVSDGGSATTVHPRHTRRPGGGRHQAGS